MADSDSVSLAVAPAVVPLSSKKENMTPISSRIAELNESRSELLSRIQGLKQDLQNWRSKLDTQVKIYRDIGKSSISVPFVLAPEDTFNHKELSELKKSLNVEVEQLRLEFQELRTTLQQQQEDVAANLRNLGLQDLSEDVDETKNPEAEVNNAEENSAPAQENTEDIQQ